MKVTRIPCHLIKEQCLLGDVGLIGYYYYYYHYQAVIFQLLSAYP